MPHPCGWRLRGTIEKPVICGKVCDAGKTLCPRHEAIAKVEEDERKRKEQARLDEIHAKRQQASEKTNL
jgi:uncharacterized Zn finger protein (UPF0148 family)